MPSPKGTTRLDISLDEIIKRGRKSRNPNKAAGGRNAGKGAAGQKQQLTAKTRAMSALRRKQTQGAPNNRRLAAAIVKRALLKRRQPARLSQRPGLRLRGRGRSTVARGGGGRRGQSRLGGSLRGRNNLTTGNVGVGGGRKRLRGRGGRQQQTSAGSSSVRDRLGWSNSNRPARFPQSMAARLGKKSGGRGTVGQMQSDLIDTDREQRRQQVTQNRQTGRDLRVQRGRPQMQQTRGRGGSFRGARGGGRGSFRQPTAVANVQERLGYQGFRARRRAGGGGGAPFPSRRAVGGAERNAFSRNGTGAKTLNERFGGGAQSRVRVTGYAPGGRKIFL